MISIWLHSEWSGCLKKSSVVGDLLSFDCLNTNYLFHLELSNQSMEFLFNL